MLLKCMDVVHNPSCRIGFLIRREKKNVWYWLQCSEGVFHVMLPRTILRTGA